MTQWIRKVFLSAIPALASMMLSAPVLADNSTDTAPGDGWAAQSGGTKGGAGATVANTYRVSTPTQLLAAAKASGTPKIIKVLGTIDMASADNGGPFKSASDQAARNAISLKSNTTLVGVGSTAKIVNGRISINKVDNVIVRNLTIVNPCDIAPTWDPNDGPTGNWNSNYDGIAVNTSTHVWIDHNKFTDAPQTDDKSPIVNGKTKQCHDGALDINLASDYVTVSYNIFDQHDKNSLVGSSDSKTSDEGHLTVTWHHNLFTNVSERSPRVRFGKVHVYNNYYVGSKSHPAYPNIYSLGIGYKAKIISQNNAFDISGATSCPDIVKNPGNAAKTGAITDSGSLLNGAALNLATKCSFSNAVGWTVPYGFTLLNTTVVKSNVIANAGVGKLTVN